MLVLSPRWLWCAETGLREGAHLIIRGDRIADMVSERPSLDAERARLFTAIAEEAPRWREFVRLSGARVN